MNSGYCKTIFPGSEPRELGPSVTFSTEGPLVWVNADASASPPSMPTADRYVLGVSPGRRLERAAQAVAEAAPDCRGVEPVGHVSVPVALMAEQQEAVWGKKR